MFLGMRTAFTESEAVALIVMMFVECVVICIFAYRYGKAREELRKAKEK